MGGGEVRRLAGRCFDGSTAAAFGLLGGWNTWRALWRTTTASQASFRLSSCRRSGGWAPGPSSRSGLSCRRATRGAYTTVQTVLNRLAERGLLSRHKVGNAIEYRPKLSEADYLSRSIARTLAGASSDARQTALARLIADLDAVEISELQRLARDVAGKRRRR
jgi:predicted transcriptional regulator